MGRRHDGGDGRGAHKTQQLCKEVERTLAIALGAVDDPEVTTLAVVAVTPAPDASRLLVHVTPTVPTQLTLDELRARLDEARGTLRAEVAAALQRKRTPELAFVVVPPGGGV